MLLNRTRFVARAAFILGASLLVFGCDEKGKQGKQEKQAPAEQGPAASSAPSMHDESVQPKMAAFDRARLSVFAPLPVKMLSASGALSDDEVALGKKLYFDPRLSKNQDISCNTCHPLNAYGVQNSPTSAGHKGQLGGRNSPTVYNAALNSAQFWDGRAKDVEEQALGPILNPVEMAMKDEGAVLAVLRSIPDYVAEFKKAFPADQEPMSYANVGKAIGAFERTLTTPSRWDKYLAGDSNALTSEERAGLTKFLDTGCNACHSGANVGGQAFQKLGLAIAWPTELKDNGRFDITKDPADKHVFRVPSLRNIEKTAPYFHDGSIASLEQAVTMMAKYQLGKDLSSADVASIVTFLKSLTGELPKIDPPTLPKSTAKTPKPDPN
ncbi:MAG: cytochrome-c peroxidase [Polyangiaceae bacterium]|nr:cytochrome-c peroxidase [Polyangiaceae bacterium]